MNLDVSVPVRMKLPNGNSLPYSGLMFHLLNNYFIPPSFASIMLSVDGLLFMTISASVLMLRLQDFHKSQELIRHWGNRHPFTFIFAK